MAKITACPMEKSWVCVAAQRPPRVGSRWTVEVRGQGDEQEQVTMWRGHSSRSQQWGTVAPRPSPSSARTHVSTQQTHTHTQSPERVPMAEEPGKNGQGDLSARGSSEGVGWHRDVMLHHPLSSCPETPPHAPHSRQGSLSWDVLAFQRSFLRVAVAPAAGLGHNFRPVSGVASPPSQEFLESPIERSF